MAAAPAVAAAAELVVRVAGWAFLLIQHGLAFRGKLHLAEFLVVFIEAVMQRTQLVHLLLQLLDGAFALGNLCAQLLQDFLDLLALLVESRTITYKAADNTDAKGSAGGDHEGADDRSGKQDIEHGLVPQRGSLPTVRGCANLYSP